MRRNGPMFRGSGEVVAAQPPTSRVRQEDLEGRGWSQDIGKCD